MKEYIQNYINATYNIDTEVVQVKKAHQLGGKHYQFSAYLVEDPLAYFSGVYNAGKDEFSELSMDFILFNSKNRKTFRELAPKEHIVLNSYIYAPGSNTDFKQTSLEELTKKYGQDCSITIHAYSFSAKSINEVDWSIFQSLFNYLKVYPEAKFSVNISFYTPELYNDTDIRSNNFSFGFNYLGVEDCFEVKNKSNLLDFFEVQNEGLDSMISKWNHKTKLDK